MYIFTADGFTGDLVDCDEGRLQWVEKSTLDSLPLWTGDKIFLSLLASDAPFFLLKLCYHGNELTQAILNGKMLDDS